MSDRHHTDPPVTDHHNDRPPRITTFRDALGLAMELADEYAFANVAALLTADGTIEDLTIAEGIGRTIEPVVSWVTDACGEVTGHAAPGGSTQPTPSPGGRTGPASPTVEDEPRRVASPARDCGPVRSVVLVTVRPYEADVVRERDLELYRAAKWSLAAAGVHLTDWIETDGDLFRSYAYLTCPADAWTDDPPSQRWQDAAL